MSTDPITKLLEEELAKELKAREDEKSFKYNPQVSSQPGEPLEVTVELPDDHTDEDMFAAMEEAARKLGFEF